MSTRNNNKSPDSILQYSFLNKTVQKEAGMNVPSLKKSLGPSTISQTKDGYSSNKTNVSSIYLNKNTLSRKGSLYKSEKNAISKSYLHSSHSQPSFNISIYEKEKERQMVLNRKIEEQRNLQHQLEMSELRPYIKMSDNSREIINKKIKKDQSLEQPLYLRENKINEKNTMRLRNIIKNENEILKSPPTNHCKTTRVFDQKKFDAFLKKNENMVIKKQKEMEKIKKQIEIEEMSSECSFFPELNKKSLLMANNPDNFEDNQTRMIRSKSFIKKEYTKFKEQNNHIPQTNHQTSKNTKVISNHNNVVGNHKIQQNKNIKGYKFQINETKHNQASNNSSNIQTKCEIRKNSRNTTQANKSLKSSKTQELTFSQNQQNYDDPFSSLYKLNIRQNLPGQIPENIIKFNPTSNVKNNSTSCIIQNFI